MADEVAQLIDVLLHKTDSKARTRAAELLMRIGDRHAVEPLITALHDPNSLVRYWAAVAVGTLKDAQAVEPLIAALHDTEPRVVTAVAVALGEIGDERAAEALITISEQNKNPYLRGAILTALAKIYHARALESRLLFLGHSQSVVREYVLIVLAGLGYKRAFLYLSQMHLLHLYVATLTDSSSRVQGKAKWLLGELAQDGEIVGHLLTCLEQEDVLERWAAIVLLGRLGDARARDALHTVVANDQNTIQRGMSVVYLKTAAAQAIKHIESRLEQTLETF